MDKIIDMSMGIYLDSKDKIRATVQDVYDWLELVESFNIPRDYKIDHAVLVIFIPVDPDKAHRIECGECAPKVINYDTLIETHQCIYDNKE